MYRPTEDDLEEEFHFGRAGAAVVFHPSDGRRDSSGSPTPGECYWRARDLGAEGLRALVPEPDAWHALLDYDECSWRLWCLGASRRTSEGVTRWSVVWGNVVEEDDRREVTGPPGHRAVVARAGRQDCKKELGELLRDALARRESFPAPAQRCLHGDAINAWIHLAARLGPRALAAALTDDVPSRMLRVCEVSGVVFRGTQRARVHPELPKQPLRAAMRVQHLGPPRVGRGRPADPFAPYARALTFTGECECGQPFTSSSAAQRLCAECGANPGRQARLRARAS